MENRAGVGKGDPHGDGTISLTSPVFSAEKIKDCFAIELSWTPSSLSLRKYCILPA